MPLDTLARKNSPRGEGAATERRAIEDRPRLEPPKPPKPHGVAQEAGGALLTSGNILTLPEVIDPFEVACVAENADAGEVEPSGFDAYKRGGALPVVGATPALAEGITGVEPASEAEKAIVARPEALVPWAQDKAGRKVKKLPQEGKHVHEPPPEVLLRKGKHEIETPSRGEGKHTDALLHGKRKAKAIQQKVERNPEALSRKRELKRPEALPPDGERERGTTPQGNPNEGALVAWDPGEKPAREDTVDLKGPVEAMDIAAGIDARNETLHWASSLARKSLAVQK